MRCGIIGRTAKNYTNMKDVSEYRSEEEKIEKEKKVKKEQEEKSRVEHSEIVAPFLTPSKFKNRKSLWEEVEKKEIRKDAQLAREILIAIPKEIKQKNRALAIREFCKTELVSKGMICDFSIHDQKKNNGNYHAHILCTLRKVKKGEFQNKERSWNEKKLVKEWQKGWEKTANRILNLDLAKPIQHITKNPKNRPYLGIKTHHLFKQAGYEMMRNYNFEIIEKEGKAKIIYKTNETRIQNEKLRAKFFELREQYIYSDYREWLENKRKELEKKLKEKKAKKLKEQEQEKIKKEKEQANKIHEEAKKIVEQNFSKNIIKLEKEAGGINLHYDAMTKDPKTREYLQKNIRLLMNAVAKEKPQYAPKNDEIQLEIKKLEQQPKLRR